MRILKILLLAMALCLLTACGGNSDPAPASSDNSTVYDCDGLEIALPNEYIDLLAVETEPAPSDWEGCTPLMNVREKASMEAAERDFGSSEDVGLLFGFARLDQEAYDQLRQLSGYGMDFFAKDGESYYARTYPTNLQFYRGEAIDEESEDWMTWELLSGLAETVQEDIVQRNGLTALEE